MLKKKLMRVALGGFMAGLALIEGRSLMNTSLQSNNSQLNENKRKPTLHNFCQNHLGLLSASADSKEPDIKPWDWNWDNRHNQSTSTSADKAQSSRGPVRHLLFVRHGEYEYRSDDADCRLTNLGREQLRYTGLRLKHLNLPYKALYYSTMRRACESADEILKCVSVTSHRSDSLREGAPYPLEPPLPYYKPSKQTFEEDGKRIESAFKEFVHRADADQTEDTYEIFVCHANVIRYIVCRALQFPPEAWIRFSLDHGSITWLVVHSDGRVNLRWLGNSGHMPSDKITIN